MNSDSTIKKQIASKPLFDKILTISKIVVIAYVSFYLMTNFIPYYEGADAYIFAISAINLSEGTYSISNELLQETGQWEFVPLHWTKTVFNTSVPNVDIGLPLIAAFSKVVSGYYGLFYLGPIFTILLLVVSERIASNLFNKYVGFITLLLLSSNVWILDTGHYLMSDHIFAILSLIGIFYLIKFFKHENTRHLLYASIFLSLSTFLRINGVIFFPVEVILVIGFIIYQQQTKTYASNSYGNHSSVFLSGLSIKKLGIISLFIILPWLLFFSVWFSFNNYYFGDPLSNYAAVSPEIDGERTSFTTQSFLSIDANRFDVIKGYFRTILPSPLSTHLNDIPNQYDHIFGKYWFGFFSLFTLISFLIISLRFKSRRLEVITFSLFIIGTLWFFTSSPGAESTLSRAVSRRYMIATFPLFFMLIGFFSIKLLQELGQPRFENRALLAKTVKIFFVLIIIVFFSIAFIFTQPTFALISNEFKLINPMTLMERYPLDLEGLKKTDVLLDSKGYKTPEYGLIPFNGLLGHEQAEEFNSSSSIQNSIQLLKKTMENGYDFYVLKEPSRAVDKQFFNYLVQNHGFQLIDHSKSFCKLQLVTDISNKTSDKICL